LVETKTDLTGTAAFDRAAAVNTSGASPRRPAPL
jgi:hypothetical protein